MQLKALLINYFSTMSEKGKIIRLVNISKQIGDVAQWGMGK